MIIKRIRPKGKTAIPPKIKRSYDRGKNTSVAKTKTARKYPECFITK